MLANFSHGMPRRNRSFRTVTHAHRQRAERTVALYLEDCYRLKVAARVSELAARLGLHPDYLSRTSPEVFGMALSDYLRQQQLAKAELLLRTMPRDLTIEEIALRCGFGTYTSLYRSFRRAYGTSPGAYRKVRK